MATRILRRVLVVGALLALSSAVGPPPAWSDGSAPSVTFLGTMVHDSASAWHVLPQPAVLTGPPSGYGAVPLTPAGLAAQTDAVSQDGNTLVVGGRGVGTTTDPLDQTQGLVLQTRDPVTSTVTARVLTTRFEGNPVLSADGGTVWWVTGGKLWKHTSGLTSLVTAGAFTPRAGEVVSALAVSPDGTKGAVMFTKAARWFHGYPYVDARILAASFATGTSGPYFTATYANSYDEAVAKPFVWADDSTLLFGMVEPDWYNAGYSNLLVEEMKGTLAPGGGSAPTFTGLVGYVDARPLGGAWWMFWMGDPWWPGDMRYGTTSDPTVEPATLIDGAGSGSRFMPSTAQPAALPSAAAIADRARARPVLLLSATRATYGSRVVYLSYNHYLTAVPGQTLADALYVDRGDLQLSHDGRAWTHVTTTTHSSPVPWPTSQRASGTGWTPALGRNTWFRWVYPGDWFTAPGTSAVTKVTVAPAVSLTLRPSGAGTSVSGRATRVGGRATVYRLLNSRLYAGASRTLSSTGTFSFGTLSLVRGGSYRVITAPDASWGAGWRLFTG